MSKIQDPSECTSNYGSIGENKLASASSGWEDNSSYKETTLLIKRANRKLKLLNIFKSYNINFSQQYRTQAWSNLIACPLPEHKDRTPSFGYNFKTDHFNCLGCKKSGKAVEFIAAKERKSKKSIAQSILDRYGESQDVKEEDTIDPRVQELLFEASVSIRNALKSSENVRDINKISGWFDNFISVRVGSFGEKESLTVEELNARVLKLKGLLDGFR